LHASTYFPQTQHQAPGEILIACMRTTDGAPQGGFDAADIRLQNPAMPSFDIVSEVNHQEVLNALNQVERELANRFDFKNANPVVKLEKDHIHIAAVDKFKLDALREIVLGKLAKRNVSLKNINAKDPQVSSVGHATQQLMLINKMETEQAKKLVQNIRSLGLKVQALIQDGEVRVSGKSRDDLQAVMQSVRQLDFDVALQFKNLRP
jgi:uncharacterized protein YajQ (UPF0234 family)